MYPSLGTLGLTLMAHCTLSQYPINYPGPGDLFGLPVTIQCEPRQARKGATVTLDSGAWIGFGGHLLILHNWTTVADRDESTSYCPTLSSA